MNSTASTNLPEHPSSSGCSFQSLLCIRVNSVIDLEGGSMGGAVKQDDREAWRFEEKGGGRCDAG